MIVVDSNDTNAELSELQLLSVSCGAKRDTEQTSRRRGATRSRMRED